MTRPETPSVFLSASFPSGDRGELVKPYDPPAIAAAVTALARGVLDAKLQLVFGAHPTISPLVMQVASDLGRTGKVKIFQSEYFRGEVPAITLSMEELGYGEIAWVDADPDGDRGRSLQVMRDTMINEYDYVAGVFIGGMQGVLDEYDRMAELRPEVPLLPLWAPGGAARKREPSSHSVASGLAKTLRSERYPALVHDLVTRLDGPGTR